MCIARVAPTFIQRERDSELGFCHPVALVGVNPVEKKVPLALPIKLLK